MLELKFNPDLHEYTAGGRRVPHVTGILKTAGLVDDRWFTEWARERGSVVHKLCELDDEGDLNESTVDPRLVGYLAAWRAFRLETGFVPAEVERKVHAASLNYCGTLDRVGTLRGKPDLVILDIKTGAPSRATGLQLAAYQRAYQETTGLWAARRWAVHLAEDGAYTLIQYRDVNDWKVFLAAATVAGWKESA